MCEHQNFITRAKVIRLKEDDSDKISCYQMELKVNCADCSLPFEFIGVPAGINLYKPMVSIDSVELRLPMKPSTDPVDYVSTLLKQ